VYYNSSHIKNWRAIKNIKIYINYIFLDYYLLIVIIYYGEHASYIDIYYITDIKLTIFGSIEQFDATGNFP